MEILNGINLLDKHLHIYTVEIIAEFLSAEILDLIARIKICFMEESFNGIS